MKASELAIRYRDHPPDSLPIRHKSMEKLINIPYPSYVGVAGMSGSGKSALVQDTFLIEMYDWWIEKAKIRKDFMDLYWIWRPMERSMDFYYGKLIMLKVFKKFGKIIEPSIFYNWESAERTLNEKEIEWIGSLDEYFEAFYKRVKIIHGPATPTKIITDFKNIMSNYGKVKDGKFIFAAEHSRKRFIHITDHLQKLRGSGFRKAIIDEHVFNMSSIVRDVYGQVAIDVCQMNRDIRDPKRKIGGDIEIYESDVKDSSNPIEMSDLFFGIISPKKLGMATYHTLDVNSFDYGPNNAYNQLRGIKVLKTTNSGADGANFPLRFRGECGGFIPV